MNFKVGDIVYWSLHPNVRWKILELRGISSAKIELIKKDNNFAGANVGAKMIWRLNSAILVERANKKRSHPLTNIFKD